MNRPKLTKSDKQWIDAYFLGFAAGRKAELLSDQIEELNSRADSQRIRNLDRFMVLSSDLAELLEVEEKLGDYIFKVSEAKEIIVKLRNRLIEKLNNLKGGELENGNNKKTY